MEYSLRILMRFSLRDLFWITVIVAMGVAWWLDRTRLATAESERQKAEAAYKESAAIHTQLVEELEKRGVSVAQMRGQTVVVGPDSAMALPPIGNPTLSTAPLACSFGTGPNPA